MLVGWNAPHPSFFSRELPIRRGVLHQKNLALELSRKRFHLDPRLYATARNKSADDKVVSREREREREREMKGKNVKGRSFPLLSVVVKYIRCYYYYYYYKNFVLNDEESNGMTIIIKIIGLIIILDDGIIFYTVV